MSGRVLVLNAGSSSLKYQCIALDGQARRLAVGSVERIGEDSGRVTHQAGDAEPVVEERVVDDHDGAFDNVIEALHGAGLDEGLDGIGHRVVHGGERYSEPTLIDEHVLAGIRELAPLAPLHNPANALGIEIALEVFDGVPQVAVFDTAFHRTMPAAAYRYAVPEAWYTRHGVRRYGAHGTSHAFVASAAAKHLGRELAELRLVTLHLGNGASAAAIAGGRCVDTSMGLTPLEGLVMGTRSGDLDPSVVFHVQRQAGLSPEQVERALNRESGLKGLCDENDVRQIERRAAGGDEDAELALSVFCHRIRKYVGAYAAVLGGLDALVFTAGIGEHSPVVRERVCEGLGFLGLAVDPGANDAKAGGARTISLAGSPAAVLVVPTDEELEIARQTLACVQT